MEIQIENNIKKLRGKARFLNRNIMLNSQNSLLALHTKKKTKKKLHKLQIV